MRSGSKSAKPMIEAVLFDYGQVLSAPPDPAAWARLRTLTALDEPDLQRHYWAHRDGYDRGELTGPAYWHKIAENSSQHFASNQIDGLIVADIDLWTQLNQPMVEWARALQAAGISTGILSNIGDAMAEGIRRRFPWLTAFDHCTWSHELGKAKPDAAIYAHAASGLGVPSDRILFLDDKEENIAAAKNAGMQTLHYRDHAGFEREMLARGLGWLLHPTPLTATAD